jgi:LemA protein
MIFLIFIIIAAIICVFLASVYNFLVKARDEIHASWKKSAEILDRKTEIILRFIDKARALIGDSEDNQLLVKIANARMEIINSETKSGKVETLGIMDGALSKFNNIIDRYPSLKADAQFAEIQAELIEINEKLTRSLKTYNNEVIYYNDKFELPQYQVLAKLFKFEPEEKLNLSDKELSYLAQ